MNIFSLIDCMCPDGVEYVPIGSLITRVAEKGKNNRDISQVYSVSNTLGMVKAEDYHQRSVHSDDTSNYTVIRNNMFAYNPSRLNVGSIALLDKEDGLVSPMYVVFSINKDVINAKYLQHLFKSSYVSTRINSLKEEGARYRFEYSRWNLIKIPLPPLEIQNEIVRILDRFTENVNILIQCLEKELEARKKQYEYYRDMLLSFGDDVEYVELGEVCDLKNGSDYKKFKNGNIPVYGSGGIINYIDTYIYDKTSILIPRKGSLKNLYYLNEPFWVVDTIFYTKIDDKKIIPKYLFYYLKVEHLEKLNVAGGVPSLTQSVLKKIKIPLPPLETQQKIVEILDRFNSLCNDISEGIPAEIEARKKQYEYYRDKLLNFKAIQ